MNNKLIMIYNYRREKSCNFLNGLKKWDLTCYKTGFDQIYTELHNWNMPKRSIEIQIAHAVKSDIFLQQTKMLPLTQAVYKLLSFNTIKIKYKNRQIFLEIYLYTLLESSPRSTLVINVQVLSSLYSSFWLMPINFF